MGAGIMRPALDWLCLAWTLIPVLPKTLGWKKVRLELDQAIYRKLTPQNIQLLNGVYKSKQTNKQTIPPTLDFEDCASQLGSL
jgi:hypothetical protein